VNRAQEDVLLVWHVAHHQRTGDYRLSVHGKTETDLRRGTIRRAVSKLWLAQDIHEEGYAAAQSNVWHRAGPLRNTPERISLGAVR
jgi:hypothetical protein